VPKGSNWATGGGPKVHNFRGVGHQAQARGCPWFADPRKIAPLQRLMLITHERDKLINAIIFFAKNTRFLGKTKLCKLLYFLDFEHFKETGRPVTGLD
jgi:hypothetical protein